MHPVKVQGFDLGYSREGEDCFGQPRGAREYRVLCAQTMDAITGAEAVMDLCVTPSHVLTQNGLPSIS